MLIEVEKDPSCLLSEVYPFFSELCDSCPELLSVISGEVIREIEDLDSLSSDETGINLDVYYSRIWCDLYMKDKLPVDEWNVSFNREVRDADSGEIVIDRGVRRVVVSNEIKCPGLMLDEDN